MTDDLTQKSIQTGFLKVEAYSRGHDYAGYCKFDALNAPAMERLAGDHTLPRLLITQAVNRIPLPLRQILGVQKTRNPKGIANFIKAYCAYYQASGEKIWLDHARELAQWLLDHDSRSAGIYSGSGRSWGYPFPWQSPGFFTPRFSPNCIVTIFCGEALLSLYQQTSDSAYLSAAKEVAQFIQNDLPIVESTPDALCISYIPQGSPWKVININAVAGGFLAKLAQVTAQKPLMQTARRLIQWTVNARQSDFTWNYTAPKSQSGIGPDNYHTGGILDGLYDYDLASSDTDFRDIIQAAMSAYAQRFFTREGAPRWRLHRTYPQDIHGAAQGILTFTKAAVWDPQYLSQASRIAHWAMTSMQDPKGYFYYQRFPGFTWKLNLMRWNNSWMAWAMAELLRGMAPR